MARLLIAGIGNIFLGDDGFGVEAAGRLASANLPPDVTVKDFGIRSLHLAYDLVDGNYKTTILLDATPRGGAPGTVYLIEPDHTAWAGAAPADAHVMNPEAVFSAVRALGGAPGRVLIVGCEPVSVEEGIGLSPPVAAAVDEAVKLVQDVVAHELMES